jgi:hypothetical protein
MPRKPKKERTDEVEEVIVTTPVVAVEAKTTTEVVTEKKVLAVITYALKSQLFASVAWALAPVVGSSFSRLPRDCTTG